ncbi:MAG: NBR1-Ig-like domain-containing protein [Anaerolineaceae bacterium]|nr:NBR1-Ig-like domain-containing protein [Anaerolineaceae bacterium]
MKRRKFTLWLGALTAAMACLPTPYMPAPTFDSNSINTFIAQTADAASTQTASAAPLTQTPSATLKPTFTISASPVPTMTFLFIMPNLATPTGTSTLATLGSGTSRSKYGCEVRTIDPEPKTVFEPRADFTATWGVRNIGTETWYRVSMSYVFYSGDKLHKVSSYVIPKAVETRKNVLLPVEMSAFKKRGTYSTQWALKMDNIYFCPMTLTIIVR